MPFLSYAYVDYPVAFPALQRSQLTFFRLDSYCVHGLDDRLNDPDTQGGEEVWLETLKPLSNVQQQSVQRWLCVLDCCGIVPFLPALLSPQIQSLTGIYFPNCKLLQHGVHLSPLLNMHHLRSLYLSHEDLFRARVLVCHESAQEVLLSGG